MRRTLRLILALGLVTSLSPLGAQAEHNCSELKAYTGVRGAAGTTTGTVGCARSQVDQNTWVALTGSDFYIHAYVSASQTCGGNTAPSGGFYRFINANNGTIQQINNPAWALASNGTYRPGPARAIPEGTATVLIGGVSINNAECATKTRSIRITVLA